MVEKILLDRLKQALTRSRRNLSETLNIIISRFKSVDESIWEEIEEGLILADIGVATTLYLIESARQKVARGRISDPQRIKDILKEECTKILAESSQGLYFSEVGPTIYLIVGVNGVGKTTTIAKMAHMFKGENKKVMISAADTFRAAAIEQLENWGDRVGVEVVSHHRGADPGAVVFDSLKAAQSRGSDLLIIDTAGRMHTSHNLVAEMVKIKKVITKSMGGAPHEVLLVLDATTGQNALSQAKIFNDALGVTGIILAKLDGTAKGGIVLTISNELKIPIKLIGFGEKAEDLAYFEPRIFVESLIE